MTLNDLRATRRHAILAIAAKHRVSGIRLFGSFARGEARNDGRLVIVAEECALHKPIRDQVLKQAVPR
jgi:predicted nucleotidyltransferase